MPDNLRQEHRHTLIIFNTYSFSTVTIVTTKATLYRVIRTLPVLFT